MIKITDRIYAETSYTCNIGWIKTEEGIILIDTPALPQDIADLKQKLRGKEIVYTIFTHEHFDHVIGGGEFGQCLIAHRNVVPEINRLQSVLPQEVNNFFPAVYTQYKNYIDCVKLRRPQITFSEALTLTPGNCRIEIFHVGGHSAASCFVYLPEAQVLFCGDTANYGMPYVTPISNFGEWIALLQRIMNMDVKTIVPGHGEICGKQEAQKILIYLENLREQINRQLDKGAEKMEAIGAVKLEPFLPVKMSPVLLPQIAYHAGLMYAELYH
ncbi:MAG: MBL fold metallo-hydrolase [Dehalococcoidales bacterium]|nr:MBL fold metallo-hydrolase [Dehalococcoidales bacterium]